MPEKTDVRTLRSRRKLRDAVLMLASVQPIESVSVADLTRKAGLKRTTFYTHASSPAHALEQALFPELDTQRAALVAKSEGSGNPLSQVWDEVLRDFLTCLDRYEQVCTTGLLDARSPVPARLLGRHFAASLAEPLDHRPDLVPVDLPRNPVAVTAYGRFVGSGAVGITGAWLESAPPRDPDLFVRIVLDVLPQWLVHPADAPWQKKEAPRS